MKCIKNKTRLENIYQSTIKYFLKSIAPVQRWDYSDYQEDQDLAGEIFEDDLAIINLGGSDRGPNDGQLTNVRTRRQENCMTYNVSDSSERGSCTPGSQYVIRYLSFK